MRQAASDMRQEIRMEKGYKKIRVYQEAHQLVLEVYKITEKFPKSELFGLVSQMRRAAVSVIANFLEGCARASKKEFKQFLSISSGFLMELEYYFDLSLDLGYINKTEYDQLEKQRYLEGLY